MSYLYWIKRNIIWIVLVLLGIILLTNLQFLPAPKGLQLFLLSNISYNLFFLLSVLCIFLAPIGILLLIVTGLSQKRISGVGLILVAIGAFGFINGIVTNHLSSYSRGIVIENASVLILAIEDFENMNGFYPDSIQCLVPDYIPGIPETGVHGIREYGYRNIKDNYEILFSQNVILNFNHNVVIYNPRGEQEGKGGTPELFDTGYHNWKYYLLD